MKSFNNNVKYLMEKELNPDFDVANPHSGAGNKYYSPDEDYVVKRDPLEPRVTAINHATYKANLSDCWFQESDMSRPKGSMLTYGLPGVGKSFSVKELIHEIAPTVPQAGNPGEMRIPVLFNEAESDVQNDVLKNPGKYFTLIDVRVAALEPADFIGVPKFQDKGNGNSSISQKRNEEKQSDQKLDFLVTSKYKWAYLATHPDTAGYLFFDEINQGDPDVLNAMYGVILERVIFDRKIPNQVAIVAAGNLDVHDPIADNEPLNKALLRRFRGVASLTVSADEWLAWAESKHIHPSIIAFINSNKSSHFHSMSGDMDTTNNRFADPDSITNLSKFMYRAEDKLGEGVLDDPGQLYKEYDRVARSILGGSWANDFMTFLVNSSKIENFVNPKGKCASEKWSNINTAHQIAHRVILTDPSLKNPDSKALISGLINYLTAVDKDERAKFKNLMFADKNEDIADGYTALRVRMKAIHDDPTNKVDPKHTIAAMEQALGDTYNSEFSQYSNSKESTNLLSVNHESLYASLDYAWDTGESLLVYGDPGIGKSWAVRKFGMSKAEEAGLPFADIFKLKSEQLNQVIANPNDYFIYLEVSVAQMAPADFMGIPDVMDNDDEFLHTKKFLWVWLATRPGVTGILFFDEINQADPQVLKAMYSIVNADDKFIFDSKISPNIVVIGAGNLASQESDTAQKSDLSLALTRRFKAGSVVLEMDGEEWLEWAHKQKGTENEIHPLILQYLMAQTDPDKFIFSRTDGYNTPDVNPDTLLAVSKKFRDADAMAAKQEAEGVPWENIVKEYRDRVHRIAESGFHPDYAQDFITFYYKMFAIDWDEIVANKGIFRDAKALRGNSSGKSILSMIWAWLPRKIETIKTIMASDPEMKLAKTRQRVEEILDLLLYYDDNYRSTFFAAFNRALSKEDRIKFFMTYIAKNPHISEELKAKANKIFLKTMDQYQQAVGGK